MTTGPSAQTTARPGVWTVDPQRSTAGFTVKNFGFVKVSGSFPIESATVTVSETGAPVEIQATLRAGGFATGNAKRDAHVRNPDFLDAERHPYVTFASTAVVPEGDGWRVRGLLTIKDQATPVTLGTVIVEINGSGARVHAAGSINRHEAGLTYGNNFGIGRLATLDLRAELVHAAR